MSELGWTMEDLDQLVDLFLLAMLEHSPEKLSPAGLARAEEYRVAIIEQDKAYRRSRSTPSFSRVK